MSHPGRYGTGMNNENPSPAGPLSPIEVMRKVFAAGDLKVDDVEGVLSTRLVLEHVEVHILCMGQSDDLASLMVRLPIRVTEKNRVAAAEFLHRLNWNAHRKFWEMDYEEGEIRLAGYCDTLSSPLDEGAFRAVLDAIVTTADTVFPYLTQVLAGRMSPTFASDQAEAALRDSWQPDA